MYKVILILFAWVTVGCSTGPGIGNPENMGATICVTDGASIVNTQAAADAWERASGGQVQLTIVDGGDCSGYETIVVAEPHLRGDDGQVACGKTDTDGRAIHIATDDCVGTLNTYTHELGHFLTGWGHSDDRADVMYHGISEVTMPTPADVARLPVAP